MPDARHDSTPFADFRYEPATGRYRWISGPSRGQLAPKAAVMARTGSIVAAEQQTLPRLATQLSDGSITLEQFQRQAGESLRRIHLGQAAMGRGGWEMLTSDDMRRVRRVLAEQFYSGVGEDGKRYGIRNLAEEVRSGRVSAAQLRSRMEAYAESGKVAYWGAWKAERPDVWGIRQLGITDRHCAFCLEQAAIAPRRVSEIPPPGCCPQCLTRCKCTIVVSDRRDALLSRRDGWL